ncbi:hypothetical protein COS31_05545 [Candidatus Roizmanbacteria bacterium CG02_land_8_20_14_3_00_36_15]|uniref:Prepilin-type N-terminal cleavage/methylation domain-containing protein n=2 Tax=Candidatus Roizmaniibacteriota TaxID=1752723 RepID=A0A2M8GLI6_9BACT|nr:MAG: hypothetical protein COS31_05545 [Candidatus Roizmanbacteria bacterium CG02_land_8_20_14_3_00_36_15]PIY70329.1 MAG: hypothetical protein COY89_01770 [Candidatus Roizmanbacteria bacterium CG_4_10_14_0_8_um_filter_36_36]PJA53104.1 MAG: hypothetical protein CO166_03020 [Candidatus Roizmanbacteria bacterium CG_4_9_14_3_um_filter_36_11]PJC81289.1 MAG: hypothetical protein CO007_05440 [Candidatus Roizmanbacteria bacterium CG_4_8_14_3_um_filter_36_10]
MVRSNTRQMKARKSFSLIELIIVVAIIELVYGISLAYYKNFSQEKILGVEAEKVSDVLGLARTKTLAADLTPKTGCTDFNGYQVEFSGNDFILVFCCSASCTGLDRVVVSSYSLPGTETFLSSSTVMFKPPIGQTDTTTITIKDSVINKCYQVMVSASGLVDTIKSICP